MKKILLLLTVAFTLTGCAATVSRSEYDALATEKAELVDRLEELTSENDELTADVEVLSVENDELQEQNRALQAENEALKADPTTQDLNLDGSASAASSSYAASVGSGISQYEYIGNRNTGKFHKTSCSTLPKEENRMYYATRNEAVNDGMVPCKRCNP